MMTYSSTAHTVRLWFADLIKELWSKWMVKSFLKKCEAMRIAGKFSFRISKIKKMWKDSVWTSLIMCSIKNPLIFRMLLSRQTKISKARGRKATIHRGMSFLRWPLPSLKRVITTSSLSIIAEIIREVLRIGRVAGTVVLIISQTHISTISLSIHKIILTDTIIVILQRVNRTPSEM